MVHGELDAPPRMCPREPHVAQGDAHVDAVHSFGDQGVGAVRVDEVLASGEEPGLVVHPRRREPGRLQYIVQALDVGALAQRVALELGHAPAVDLLGRSSERQHDDEL
jgi:hypothetical protein